MRYMLLIYTDESQEANQSPEERQAVYERYFAYSKEVRERGVFEAGDELQPTSTATTVRVRDGRMLVSDGPFAETKEQLGGYYILNCKDLDEAIELAAKLPAADQGSIEIRPLTDFD